MCYFLSFGGLHGIAQCVFPSYSCSISTVAQAKATKIRRLGIGCFFVQVNKLATEATMLACVSDIPRINKAVNARYSTRQYNALGARGSVVG
jgi:hypothetical protein